MGWIEIDELKESARSWGRLAMFFIILALICWLAEPVSRWLNEPMQFIYQEDAPPIDEELSWRRLNF